MSDFSIMMQEHDKLENDYTPIKRNVNTGKIAGNK
jgi:hypothetical protein